ncbi:hypothetical protein LX32DRAFT_281487 [Colletotrichum zoysiae]|uniref:Secreted protein n=1 Tax=Colletotrichum zoysiae TaxID=1216348 RepID=A0AAD9H347_9PEZI|nr:hypothetical protein LX32DRAFT_281487 [Colletotrichum zoysiae]
MGYSPLKLFSILIFPSSFPGAAQQQIGFWGSRKVLQCKSDSVLLLRTRPPFLHPRNFSRGRRIQIDGQRPTDARPKAEFQKIPSQCSRQNSDFT